MRRYYAFTLKTLNMEWLPEHSENPYGRYEVVLAADHDAAVKELVEALSETLDKIMWFRIWFEDEYLRDIEEDDPLLTEVARLGLNGRAETVLEKYRSDA